MSGRSGFVRAKQATGSFNKDGNNRDRDGAISPVALVPTSPPWTASTSTSTQNRPANHFLTNVYLTEALRASNRSNIPVEPSTRVLSNLDNDPAYARGRRPNISNIESNIEKSALRVALDNQSDSIRHTLGDIFSGKKKGQDVRPGTAATNEGSIPELDSGVFRSQLDFEPKSAPPTSPIPPTYDVGPTKRWAGPGAKDAQENFDPKFDLDVWFKDGDTMVFLQPETAPPAPPLFRLHSKVLRTAESIVLTTLLEENIRRRQSVVDMVAGLKKLVHEHPSHANRMMPYQKENLEGCRYTLYLPPPEGLDPEEFANWAQGTRNALAVLHDTPLIGDKPLEMLTAVHERMTEWTDEGRATERVIKYLRGKSGLSDVQSAPEAAAGLLGFSENPSVRWAEGYREGFVHCVGMHPFMAHTKAYHDIKPVTRQLLERHSLEMQGRTHLCAKRLEKFKFAEDMWAVQQADSEVARQAMVDTQDFFCEYYTRLYGSWPPPPRRGHMSWFTRDIARVVQEDFSALYDYIVDRSVTFEDRVHRLDIVRIGDPSFTPNADGVRMTEIITRWDQRNQYPNIPHPFPLLPRSIPVVTERSQPLVIPEKTKKNPFKKLTKNKKKAAAAVAEEQKQPEPELPDLVSVNAFQVAYSEANNLVLLQERYSGNTMVEAFQRYEREYKIAEIDPQVARRGRWIVVYGVLQTLATIVSDTPELFEYNSRAEYFLSTCLDGTPPWNANMFHAAKHLDSHCFTVPQTWIAEDVSRGASSYASGYSTSPSAFYQESEEYSVRSPTSDDSPRYDNPVPVGARVAEKYSNIDLRAHHNIGNQGYPFMEPHNESRIELPVRNESRLLGAYSQRLLPEHPQGLRGDGYINHNPRHDSHATLVSPSALFSSPSYLKEQEEKMARGAEYAVVNTPHHQQNRLRQKPSKIGQNHDDYSSRLQQRHQGVHHGHSPTTPTSPQIRDWDAESESGALP